MFGLDKTFSKEISLTEEGKQLTKEIREMLMEIGT